MLNLWIFSLVIINIQACSLSERSNSFVWNWHFARKSFVHSNSLCACARQTNNFLTKLQINLFVTVEENEKKHMQLTRANVDFIRVWPSSLLSQFYLLVLNEVFVVVKEFKALARNTAVSSFLILSKGRMTETLVSSVGFVWIKKILLD